MGATLANGGTNPLTGDEVFDVDTVSRVLSVMSSCGMYDDAGEWMVRVGLPAKSGVGGGIIAVLPGELAVATFSPALDRHGNSVRGVRLFERLSDDMGMHLMEIPAPGQAVLRKVRRFDGSGPSATVFQLQGMLGFTTAEVVTRAVIDHDPRTDRVVFDLERLHRVDDVGRVMLLEVCRRLSIDGRDVILFDSEGILTDPNPGDGGTLRVVTSLEQLRAI